MPSTGTRLAYYEIGEMLGAGGMGEVFRARDTRLGRDVAIKFAPPAANRERFEREARVLAALNHPNIAAIYDVALGERPYLVMELVEGETLRGPLSLEEAIGICIQIAEGLAAAHDKGIIHRDLKPANVKLTPAGKVKVLDFGLGKAVEDSSKSAAVSHSPTITVAATQAGVILGTAAYMSPEQARGKPVDRRTDIWSLGCVLYELLTGKQAFAGDTVSDCMAAILRAEPDLDAAPPRVRKVLGKCLEKDPDRRLHDMHDLRLELEEALAPPQAFKAVTPRGRWLLPAVCLIAIAALAFAVYAWFTQREAPRPVMRFTVSDSSGQELGPFTLSPDGSGVAYVRYKSGSPFARDMWFRSFKEFESKRLAGAEGGNNPFFAPDGNSIGFTRNGQIWRIPIGGGGPVPVAGLPRAGGRTVAWTSSGHIFFTSGRELIGEPVWRRLDTEICANGEFRGCERELVSGCGRGVLRQRQNHPRAQVLCAAAERGRTATGD
jgi:serine/threonine protein kinase